MSSVTGPNEGGVMWPRRVHGLSLWQALPPPDARHRTIDDLDGVTRVTHVRDGEMSAIKNVLDMKPAETPSGIGDLLRAGSVTEADLDRMGL